MSDDVAKKVMHSCDELGDFSLVGVKLEDADPKLLDIRLADLNDHVAIQPAAIAYYGMLKKIAARALERLRTEFDLWQKLKYAESQSALSGASTKAPTKPQVESHYVSTFHSEIKEWHDKIGEAQAQADALDAWYEAWRQKSFAMHDRASMANDEYMTSDSIDEKPGVSRPRRVPNRSFGEKKAMVKGIMRRGKKTSSDTGKEGD